VSVNDVVVIRRQRGLPFAIWSGAAVDVELTAPAGAVQLRRIWLCPQFAATRSARPEGATGAPEIFAERVLSPPALTLVTW